MAPATTIIVPIANDMNVCREHGREREQERNAGADERAEHDEEDGQRQRDGEQPRACELRREELLERLPGRSVASLPDMEISVLGLYLRRRGRKRPRRVGSRIRTRETVASLI